MFLSKLIFTFVSIIKLKIMTKLNIRVVRLDEQGNEIGKPTSSSNWQVSKEGYLLDHKGTPIFNAQLIEKLGYDKNEIKGLTSKEMLIRFSDVIIRYNHDNYRMLVENMADRKQKQEQEEVSLYKSRNELIPFVHNMVGLLIITKDLPEKIWAIARPYARYEKYSEEMEEWVDDQFGWAGAEARDFVGWHYQHEAIDAFLKAGYRVSYASVEVFANEPINEQIKTINAEKVQESEEAEAQAKAERERKVSLNRRIADLETEYEYPSPEQLEKDQVSSLTHLLAPSINYAGANIYGGGGWLLLDSNYLYIVRNNGMDGDDWSRSNLVTGGAGAICCRVQRNSIVNQLISDIAEYDTHFAESIKEN